jgi:muramoyltetrapeptide carboxypeptidase LdcA involved in peptidoglycan recycling
VVLDAAFGHVINKITIPIGAIAKLNPSNQSLLLLEPIIRL